MYFVTVMAEPHSDKWHGVITDQHGVAVAMTRHSFIERSHVLHVAKQCRRELAAVTIRDREAD